MHAIYQKQSGVLANTVISDIDDISLSNAKNSGEKDNGVIARANSSNALLSASASASSASAATTAAAINQQKLKTVNHFIGVDYAHCNSCYNGIQFELNNKQQTDIFLKALQFRSSKNIFYRNDSNNNNSNHSNGEESDEGKLYIRRGFHNHTREIAIEQFEPIMIQKTSQNFSTSSSSSFRTNGSGDGTVGAVGGDSSYGVRTWNLANVNGYRMEAGETYTILIHCSSNSMFIYSLMDCDESDQLANELFYQNEFYSVNTGYHVNEDFECVRMNQSHSTRKFNGRLTFAVEKH